MERAAAREREAPSAEAALLSRVIRPVGEGLSAEAARALLRVGFDRDDLGRLHDLLARNQAGELAADERPALDDYLRVSAFIDLMHSEARRALRARG